MHALVSIDQPVIIRISLLPGSIRNDPPTLVAHHLHVHVHIHVHHHHHHHLHYYYRSPHLHQGRHYPSLTKH